MTASSSPTSALRAGLAWIRRERVLPLAFALPLAFVALGLVARAIDPALRPASFAPSVLAVSIVALVAWALAWAATRRVLVATALVAGLLWLVEFAGTRKLQELGIALVPQDLAALQDLLQSPDLFRRYADAPGWALLLPVALVALAWIEPPTLPARSVRRVAIGLCAALLGASLAAATWPLRPLFDEFPEGVHGWSSREAVGQIGDLHFFLLEHFGRSDAAASADPAVLADLDARIRALPAAPGGGGERPDILMVQVEAMFDPSILRREPPDLLPGFRALAARGMHGWMVVPAYGGRTTRTEFEALTGIALQAAFPRLHYPFRGLVDRPVPSIASHLRGLGYSTLAVHPYDASFYGRNRIYPRLGFDRFHAIEDFRAEEVHGDYVSTEATLARMRELADASDAPAFVFGVTMENHGPWPRTSLPRDDAPALAIAGLDPAAEAAWRGYAHHLAREDRAIAELWQVLQARERWTVLVVYGDHLPGLEAVWAQAGFDDGQPPDQQRVPWLAIDNRGRLAGEEADLAASELGAMLIARLGLPADPHFTRVEGIRRLAATSSPEDIHDWRRHAGLDRYARSRTTAASGPAAPEQAAAWIDAEIAVLEGWGPQRLVPGLEQIDLWTRFATPLPRGAVLMLGEQRMASFAVSPTELAGQLRRAPGVAWTGDAGRYEVFLALPAERRRQRLGALVVAPPPSEPAAWIERPAATPPERWGPRELASDHEGALDLWFVPLAPPAEGVRVRIGDQLAATFPQPDGAVTAQLPPAAVAALLAAPGAHPVWFEWPERGERERVAMLEVRAPVPVPTPTPPSACTVREWGPGEAVLGYLRRSGESFRLYARLDCPTHGLALAVGGERLATEAGAEGLLVATVPGSLLQAGRGVEVTLVGEVGEAMVVGTLEVRE